MRYLIKYCLGAFLLFTYFIILPGHVFCQENNFHFINFSNRDGLSSNSITCVFKDKYGYMWFGTDDGLNKYDGVSFTTYRYSPGDSTTLASNSIIAICEDPKGNLWIGTDISLTLYDRSKNRFTNYDFTRHASVRAMCADHLGNLWIGGYGGVFKFNPATQQITHYENKRGRDASDSKLASNTILSAFEDSRKRLWIGTSGGLHLYIPEADNFRIFTHDEGNRNSVSDNVIRSITEDAAKNIWVATHNGGVCKLMSDGKSFQRFKHNPSDINTLSSNTIYSIAADNNGQIWVGSEEGLNILDITTSKVTRVASNKRLRYSLAGKSVQYVYIDKAGIYWVSTLHGGVSKYDKNLAFFSYIQGNPLDPSGLSSSYVTSFAEGLDGNIYIGTDGGGLNLYNPKLNILTHPKLTIDSINNTLAVLALERSGDELWVGTFQHGLFVLNIKTGAVKHVTAGTDDQSIASNEIFCLKKDSRNRMWIGTNGKGVNMYDPVKHIFKKWNKEVQGKGYCNLISDGFIRSIAEDRNGSIWIGSVGAGIAVYQPYSNNCMLLSRYSSGLPVNKAYQVFVDSKGDIWAGTPNGLSIYNVATGKFKNYTEADGLGNSVIYTILEDNDGKIWVSTNKGLSSFDKKTKQFKNYSYYNGLQRSSFSLGAAMKTSQGEMYFGGHEGFNFFNPAALNVNKTVPALVFTDFKMANTSVIPSDDAPIKEDISVAQKISLNYKQNFSIDFAALNYTSPHETRYTYKLAGFDKQWINAGTSHTAAYTNLDPGTYTFHVIAKSYDGSWETPQKSIKIYVKPPFWLTIYAYIFYVLLAIFIIAFVRYRGIQKMKMKFEQEQERRREKQIIEEIKKEAERKHEFDEQRIRFLTNLSHELRTPVSLIIGPVEKMIGNEANESKAKQLTVVHRNARRLLNLVNQLLDFRKIQENEMKLNLQEADIVSFVKEVAESFKEIAEARQIDFNFSSSLGYLPTAFDHEKIERVLFNLLSNAFKFTPRGGKIAVDISIPTASEIGITITDTGIGLPKAEEEKIFDRFYQVDMGAEVVNQGSGIGLSIAREFIKMHGGTIIAESEIHKGSRFSISLPFVPATGFEEEINKSIEIQDQLTDKEKKKGQTVANADKKVILLVEDNDDFRAYLRDNLQDSYKIIEAVDGKEGWQKALSSHPELIVSDINMPEMDGITLCKKLKSDKRTSHIPVILLTALTGQGNQLRGLRTGASDYLSKPFSFEILNIKMRNLLDLNQSLKKTYSRQLIVDVPKLEAAGQPEDEKLLMSITSYIEKNIDSPQLTVEDLSKQVFMSRGSLYNKIVALTGETPVEFIRSIRLKKAVQLLESSNMKVAEIGYAVGFSTPAYFAKAFKSKFNVSPSEYLASKKKNSNLENESDDQKEIQNPV